MTEARIGPAAPDDVAILAALSDATLAEPWSPAAFASERALPEARLLVARDAGGRLVAYLVARRVLDELHVLSLAVATGWRRKGLATRLLTAALGAEPALAQVHLEVRAGDAAARAFYAARGFAAVGRRRGHYADGEDALLLARTP